MMDIIAAQQIKRRSRPSLLSTAQEFRVLSLHAAESGKGRVFPPGHSFIADQYLPKRKKKRLLEKVRSSFGKQGFIHSRNPGFLSKKLARQKILYKPGLPDISGFIKAAGAFFTRIPKNVFLGLFLCLFLGCLALLFNYIPAPEPPEETLVREQGLRPAVSDSNGGDEIPLDLTEVFAWQGYTVRSGDSVEGIARRFGLSIDAVIASNNLRNVRRLQAGEKIRIPNMDGIPYTVKSGDSYSLIANAFGTPLEAILDANDIQSEAINAGTVLFIPGARMDKNELRQALGELFAWPISGRISSGFGWRNDPFTGVRSFHAGLDISGPTGLSVKASSDGRVSAVGYNAVYGNFIIVTHSAEYQTMYAHLSKILVKNGASVNQGAVIGQVGSTGRSTASHLHFSVYKNKRAISPLEVLNK